MGSSRHGGTPMTPLSADPRLQDVLQRLRGAAPVTVSGPLPTRLVTRVADPSVQPPPPSAPVSLRQLWAAARELEVHRDVDFGQWGCLLHDPEWSSRARERWNQLYPDKPLSEEWVVGEFLGDCELVVVLPDGGVVIAQPMDPRAKWPRVADSLAEFLARYFADPDRKYWARLQEPRN